LLLLVHGAFLWLALFHGRDLGRSAIYNRSAIALRNVRYSASTEYGF
jgi:hypothetical protein